MRYLLSYFFYSSLAYSMILAYYRERTTFLVYAILGLLSELSLDFSFSEFFFSDLSDAKLLFLSDLSDATCLVLSRFCELVLLLTFFSFLWTTFYSW